eukprot:254638-Prymnesium_polylepis.1
MWARQPRCRCESEAAYRRGRIGCRARPKRGTESRPSGRRRPWARAPRAARGNATGAPASAPPRS